MGKELELNQGYEDTMSMLESGDEMSSTVKLEYWEEFSVMGAIYPKGEEDFFEDTLKSRIESLDNVKCLKFEHSDENNCISFKVRYKDSEYDFYMFRDIFEPPIFFNSQRMYFTKDDEERISQSDTVLNLYMDVQGNPLESIHLQIKLLYAMVPNMLAVYAESCETMLNKREVAMTAKSKIGLRPMDLYQIQGVKSDTGDIWLHTHGLLPLGIPELEILGANEENADLMLNLINSVASQMIEKLYEEENEPNDEIVLFVGNASDGAGMVATVVPWIVGVKEYEHDSVQGLFEDRKESHNGYTSLIFLYASEEDYHNEILTKPAEFAEKIGDNPLFIFGTYTTEIISELAKERISYPQKALELQKTGQENDISVIAKIAVDVIDNSGERTVEHVWFDVEDITDDEITGILSQELFFDGGIACGERGTYSLSKLTDWNINFKGNIINSRVAYLFDILQG